MTNRRIADVQCSRIKFEPGDRVLVKVHHKLTRNDQKKLERSIKAWAGKEVRVLIVDTTFMEIEIDRRSEQGFSGGLG